MRAALVLLALLALAACGKKGQPRRRARRTRSPIRAPTRATDAALIALWRDALGRHSHCTLAACFALYGLVFAAFFALTMPPYQNADEPAHMLRAAQVSQGQLIGVRFGAGLSGGKVDAGVFAASHPFDTLPFHPDVKATAAMYRAAQAVRWTSDRRYHFFSNTAVYPPVFYAPAASALWLARWLDCTMLRSLTLARLANAVAAVVLGAAGIALAGRSAPVLFALLCLPMSWALMANVSQDGVMLGTCALAAGLALAPEDGTRRRYALPAMTAALALVCMARPPYLPFAVLPLLVRTGSRRQRRAAALSVVALTLAWAVLVARYAVGVLRPDNPAASAAGQLAWMAQHPGALLPILVRSIAADAATMSVQFIGLLGWQDVALPPVYFAAAALALLLAAIASTGQASPAPAASRWGEAASLACALAGSIALVYLAQYVTWTEVGQPAVLGVQGRYFLAPALLFAPALQGLRVPFRGASTLRMAAIAALALFPVATLGVVMRAVVVRYFI